MDWVKKSFVGIAAALIFSNGIAKADPLPVQGIQDEEWRFDVSPYLFLPASVSGDSTVAGQSASLDLDTSDLLDFFKDYRVEIRANMTLLIKNPISLKIEA